MSALEEAYHDLFPEKKVPACFLEYSGRLKPYNGRIQIRGSSMKIVMSKTWRGVSPEIQKGLFQELMVRVFKARKQTINMELYHNFIRNLSRVAVKKKTHPILEESFSRVNSLLFSGIMEQPNLKVGKGINRLGTYEYATDTITISQILLDNPELMDYVMYHELLHKKHQYKNHIGRCTHHSREFLQDEIKFPNAEFLERELERLVMRERKGWF